MPRLPKASTHADSAPALGHANRSMASHLPRQRDIRRALIEADLVDCMVALQCGCAKTLPP